MKLTKKIIAAAAALAMTMTSMTGVLADNTSTIVGDADYVNTTVYKVTLPTTNGMSFTLDPQGLLTATNGNLGGGQVGIVTSEGVMVAKNESSVDVDFSAKFYVECDASTSVVAANDANVANTTTSTKEAVALQIAVDTSMATSAVAVSITPVALDTVVASTTKTDVTATSSAVASAITDVELKAAPYIVTGDATTGFDYIKDPDEDDATFVYMGITGKVNPNADWSAYATGKKTIKLNAVFGFKSKDGEDVEAEAGTNHQISQLPNGNYACDTIAATTGNLTSVIVDGVDRSASIERGFFVYNVAYQRFAISGSWPLIPTLGAGDHTVEVILDGQTYTIGWTLE